MVMGDAMNALADVRRMGRSARDIEYLDKEENLVSDDSVVISEEESYMTPQPSSNNVSFDPNMNIPLFAPPKPSVHTERKTLLSAVGNDLIKRSLSVVGSLEYANRDIKMTDIIWSQRETRLIDLRNLMESEADTRNILISDLPNSTQLSVLREPTKRKNKKDKAWRPCSF